MRRYFSTKGPFYDFKALRARAPYLAANAAARRAPCDVAGVLALHERHAAAARAADALRAERNAQARGGAAPSPAAAAAARALKERLALAEAAAAAARGALEAAAGALPCDTHPAAPRGDESRAVTLGVLGAPRAFAFPPRDHVALGSALGLLDLEASAGSAGAGFATLRGPGVALELALVQWALARCAGAGFALLAPPDVALAQLVEGCGFAPRAAPGGAASQVYALADSPLCLVGTAEIPLAALHAGGVLELPCSAAAAPPLLYAGWGRCFRREAGGAGAATRGLYRLHQFTKVEMFAYVVPGAELAPLREPGTFFAPDSARALLAGAPPPISGDAYTPALCPAAETLFARLVDLQVSMLSELGLCARVLDMPTEELGASAFRKVDCEVWMPGMPGGGGGVGRWGEVSSASNCMDYQARRLGMRYRAAGTRGGGGGDDKGVGFLHTLNATAAAVPRLLLSILETHQTEDGCVEVPACLQPYMGGVSVLRPVASGAGAAPSSRRLFGVSA